jgi:hypothetical protein
MRTPREVQVGLLARSGVYKSIRLFQGVLTQGLSIHGRDYEYPISFIF